jgi:RND family efflux transporter MFP subunit
LGAFTLFQRRAQYHALAETTEALAIPTVAVIHPTAEVAQEDLVLPGTLQAYVESPIYARTNGYLKKWYHDIGSRVPKGELLADIDTPEVDQQLSQARADLNTAQANANLSRITSNRFQDLIKTDGVSKQEVDNAVGDYEAKAATVKSSEANVRRLEELESFKHVYAPFSGVLTKRNIDTGTLINAGNGGAQQELFTLAQTDPIRVYVSVPEMYSPSVRSGLGAFLELAQYPGQNFQGKVVRTAEAIDPNTRTLLTEVDVPNKTSQLFPGGYAQVHLQVKVAASRVQVPVNALLFRAEGLRAAVVDANHKIHLRQLTIGRDFGTTLEVLQGLEPADWIVLNPADSLDEGQDVRVKEAAQAAGPAQSDASGAPASAPRTKAPNANGAPGAKR